MSRSPTLPTTDVLGTRIRNDIHWTEHMFRVSKDAVSDLKLCKKYFTAARICTYIQPKLECNSKFCLGTLEGPGAQTEIWRPIKPFNNITKLSQCFQPLGPQLPLYCTVGCRDSLFLNRTVRCRYNLPIAPDVFTLKLNIHKHYSLLPSVYRKRLSIKTENFSLNTATILVVMKSVMNEIAIYRAVQRK